MMIVDLDTLGDEVSWTSQDLGSYLDCLERQDEDTVDVVKDLPGSFHAIALLEVEPDLVQIELATVVLGVFVLYVSW